MREFRTNLIQQDAALPADTFFFRNVKEYLLNQQTLKVIESESYSVNYRCLKCRKEAELPQIKKGNAVLGICIGSTGG